MLIIPNVFIIRFPPQEWQSMEPPGLKIRWYPCMYVGVGDRTVVGLSNLLFQHMWLRKDHSVWLTVFYPPTYWLLCLSCIFSNRISCTKIMVIIQTYRRIMPNCIGVKFNRPLDSSKPKKKKIKMEAWPYVKGKNWPLHLFKKQSSILPYFPN